MRRCGGDALYFVTEESLLEDTLQKMCPELRELLGLPGSADGVPDNRKLHRAGAEFYPGVYPAVQTVGRGYGRISIN
jgi:hypothetical protein